MSFFELLIRQDTHLINNQNMISTLSHGSSSEIKNDGFDLSLKSIEVWLYKKNIFTKNDTLLEYSDLDNWYRSGVETFLSKFKILYKNNNLVISKILVIKAIISTPVHESLKNWSRRRNLLKKIGIKVTEWYWWGNGIIIEDFYPKEYKYYKNFDDIIDIAYLLDLHGFNSLSFLNDLRCDNLGTLYYTDFGFDLGDPQNGYSNVAINHLKVKIPEKKQLIDKLINSKKMRIDLVNTIGNYIKEAQQNQVSYKKILWDDSNDLDNEFLFFIKPEITLPDKKIDLESVIDLILKKIEEFELKIKSITILGSNYLKEHNIIAQHYGVINKISNNATRELPETAKENFRYLFNKNINECKYLGGFEFLENYKCFNSLSLDYLWQNKPNKKLAGGTYVTDFKLDNEIIYIINGFHPRQLDFFTEYGRSIVAFTLKSNLDWSTARNNFIGSTQPSAAKIGSIRRELLENSEALGLLEVSQGFNGVHLSAGPVEGLIELIRYNSNFSIGTEIKQYNDFQFGKMLDKNFSTDSIKRILSNVNINVDGKSISVFDYTEEKNSDEAISVLKKIFV